ncbi:hypothetical protein S40285_01973 [Stachybotrys chlorohalonatus IBT 40285]|uniref:Uncharacterized protein n=1 Tax=Stachybotrys chlorohalonatus (strain IBT 40285) TaxID=1283841 RepID=A0A084QIG5_STAC4|nr:hypothetical protein S40285_01973 [Stachybotrys chlorohalonata IBT 40285]
MFATPLRRLGQIARKTSRAPPAPVGNNPHKARKLWPPDFEALNPQQQLRFEKKYKRRVILASRAPRWDKAVKLTQFIAITATIGYLVFYGEFEWWGREYTPYDEIRRHVRNLFGVLDQEKRYERRKDAPEYIPPTEPRESK